MDGVFDGIFDEVLELGESPSLGFLVVGLAEGMFDGEQLPNGGEVCESVKLLPSCTR